MTSGSSDGTSSPLLSNKNSKEDSDLHLLLSLPPEKLQDKEALKIAIIGAGVAGLLTARVLKSRGFSQLTLFESGDKVGGVWAEGYPNFAVQTPGSLYEFPDMPLPEPKDFKDGVAVQKYCEDYVKAHDLQPLIKLNCHVDKITKQEAENTWKLTLSSGDVATFDFVVLATGLYCKEHKYIPDLPGLDNFKGQVVHSHDSGRLSNNRKGKQVVVVGFGASALDCARTAFEQTGVPPVLSFRVPHWCVPRKVLGLIPMEYLIYSRFGQGTLPRAPCLLENGPMERVFQASLMKLYWSVVSLFYDWCSQSKA